MTFCRNPTTDTAWERCPVRSLGRAEDDNLQRGKNGLNPHVAFGGGATETVMSPIVLAAMGLTVVLLFWLPRRSAIVPFLLFAFLTPMGQQFNLGGIHLYALRIVILAGCVRLLRSKLSSRGSVLAGGFNSIDRAFLWLYLVQAVGYVLVYREIGAAINQVGTLWDFLGGYFLIRYLIQDRSDILRVAKTFVVIAVILAPCMLYEKVTMANPFALLMGGKIVPDIRDGHIRCRGIFAQQILASAFGGTLVPLFLWLWRGGGSRGGAVLGITAAGIITITSSSSTGISALGFAVIALCLWPLRRHMRLFRWGVVSVVLGLALVMKAPIWFLLARVDLAGGSTGWDRAHLIDVFARHVGDWWLFGAGQMDYMKWLDVDYGWDLPNQYIAACASGGLAALTLLIVLISRSFRKLGTARRMAREDLRAQQLLWVLGAVMSAHLAAFMGIAYFDQTRLWWFVTLAMISAATAPCLVAGDIRPKAAQRTMSEPSSAWCGIGVPAEPMAARGIR